MGNPSLAAGRIARALRKPDTIIIFTGNYGKLLEHWLYPILEPSVSQTALAPYLWVDSRFNISTEGPAQLSEKVDYIHKHSWISLGFHWTLVEKPEVPVKKVRQLGATACVGSQNTHYLPLFCLYAETCPESCAPRASDSYAPGEFTCACLKVLEIRGQVPVSLIWHLSPFCFKQVEINKCQENKYLSLGH